MQPRRFRVGIPKRRIPFNPVVAPASGTSVTSRCFNDKTMLRHTLFLVIKTMRRHTSPLIAFQSPIPANASNGSAPSEPNANPRQLRKPAELGGKSCSRGSTLDSESAVPKAGRPPSKSPAESRRKSCSPRTLSRSTPSTRRSANEVLRAVAGVR